MAHRAAQDIAHMAKPRLGPDATPAEQDALIAQVLERALDAANDAVERGPDQLPVLKEAGVVDAGAYGLTVIVAGVVAALRGDERPALAHQPPPRRAGHLPEHESSSYRFCTNFAVTGRSLDGQAFVPRLEGIGDSVLVVGDERTLRVHVHTDDPASAVAIFQEVGEVSRLDVADMHEQVAERSARVSEGAQEQVCAVVAVASGPGIARLFRDLGVLVVDGGPTMNPSTYEILAGIHAANADEILVLPNSPNVRMAADRAAGLSEAPARVVPTRAQQEGLAALLAFDSTRGVEENAKAVGEAAAALAVGGVAPSAREDPQGRFAPGDAVGYRGDDLVAWGDPTDTLRATLARVADGAELVTCIAGAGAPLDRAEIEAALPGGVELDYHDGGQPAWWWLLCAE